jgi:hypothetical protein
LEPATINVSKPAAVSVPPMTKHQRYIWAHSLRL